MGQFPVEDPDYEVGIEETYALPYYGTFAPGGIDAGLGPVAYDENAPVIWDRSRRVRSSSAEEAR